MCQTIQNLRQFFHLSGLALLLALSACAVTPEARISHYANRHGMTESVVSSTRFKHVVFYHGGVSEAADNNTSEAVTNDTQAKHESDTAVSPNGSKSLHVYLEGDGLPWILRYFRMKNPTPRRALMLELMGVDRQPSLYIGRPCYNGFSQTAPCEVSMWTSGRYSPTVVESMVAVLKAEIDRRQIMEVTLFGHSGGGTLALLIAEKMPAVNRVVTIAGNLDVDAWITHHAYSPLYTSLNPASRAPLPRSIEQIHFMGDSDSNIPPSLNSAWVSRQWNSYGVRLAGVTHSCCWPDLWSRILATLEAGQPYKFPGTVFKKPLVPDALN